MLMVGGADSVGDVAWWRGLVAWLGDVDWWCGLVVVGDGADGTVLVVAID